MTLTVCLSGTDGLVLASDSRGTFGDPRGITAQNDTIKKLYFVQDVGILLSGSQEANLIIEEVGKLSASKSLKGATLVMQEVRKVAMERFDEWYKGFPLFPVPGQNPAFVRNTLQLTVAGYDISEKDALPRMYSMVSNYNFTPNLHDFGFALGGIAQYALYLLNRLYVAGMETTSLAYLAAYVITETASQDGKVGGPVQMGIVTPKGSRILSVDEIGKILAENERKNRDLRGFFKKV